MRLDAELAISSICCVGAVASFANPQLSLVCVPALLYSGMHMRIGGKKDSRALAKRVEALDVHMKESGCTITAVGEVESGELAAAPGIARPYRLGAGIGNFAGSDADVARSMLAALDGFVSPNKVLDILGREVKEKHEAMNWIEDRIKLSEILDISGICVFFPMFAGVISDILRVGISTGPVPRTFGFVVIAYCAIMAAAWSAFRHIGQAKEFAYDFSRISALAAIVYFVVSSYVAVIF